MQYGELISRLTYQRVNPSWTLAQLLWLKEREPETWSRLRRVLVTKDYVRYRFTGTYQTDTYDAIGTQLYDVRARDWSQELCDILGFPLDRLPPVSSAWSLAGTLQPDAARDTGLLSGIPVAVGSGDTVMEAYAVRAVDPGQCIVKLGSAACVNVVTSQPHPMPSSLTYVHVVPGRWFTIMATNSGASTHRWFGETFLGDATEPDSIPDAIERLAASAPPGCEGLLFHPYLMGERSPHWDPHLRGDLVGIGAHHELRHFARAILEGVAFSVRDCARALDELPESVIDRRLTGGGAQSAVWRQILCDILGHALTHARARDAAFGSALLAGVAAGLFPDWRPALAACPVDEERLEPDPGVHALYDEYFDVYCDVARDLVRHSHRLADLADSGPTAVEMGATRADQEA
jgi:xylulokinase